MAIDKKGRFTTVPLEDRFWPKVDVGISGLSCWEWTAGVNHHGYGYIRHEGKNHQAHRVAYELLVGPILEGLQIDHLCRNRKCVNPDHLEPVTPAENIRRKVYNPMSAKTQCKEGHEFNEENTYHRPAGGRGCKECKRVTLRKSRARRRVWS